MPYAEFDGSTILITGGTGSLGKQLTQYILANWKPKKLIIFSRDELKQYEMQQQLSTERYPCLRYFIGDVRDRERLIRAFHGVDYVVHAAALKQVPAAEYNPAECIRTNVMGAMHVIDAALENGVKRVIALSTDKACNPINLYGATKLCSDKLFIAANAYGSGHEKVFTVVRYGNVIGSRGSVIPYFRQCAVQGVIPVTDPRMTRFWITLDQAARFVLGVLMAAKGYEIFVPKIPSMKISDLAEAIAPGVRQEHVGIRPGEKIHEVLIGRDDSRNTLEFRGYYMLLPQDRFAQRAAAYRDAARCRDGFEYSSDSNSWFFDVSHLRQAIAVLDGAQHAEHLHIPIATPSGAPV
ncbi:MAG: UDP-N-acetylglucosamine 4,6-dehydratase (inverting) [bacterium]|nr:UDP-N-acetylglucosamine 4,6-dehydratase (inverting) [bacterium]